MDGKKRVVQMETTTDESIITEPMGKSTFTFIIYLHEESCGNLLWHYLASERQGWRRQNQWWLRCYWWQQPTRYRCSRIFTLIGIFPLDFAFNLQLLFKNISNTVGKLIERINKSSIINDWSTNKDISGNTPKTYLEAGESYSSNISIDIIH